MAESLSRRARRMARGIAAAAAVVAAVCLLMSCGTKKNTAASRAWQAFTTRYNVYYNGKEHYNEQLKAMERAYEDDYTRTLLTHPAEAKGDAKLPQPTGDFTRTIEKMQKAIQLHSIKKKPARRNSSPKEKAFRAREEFNPFLHNAWLTLGKAQYLNGDFLGAASTFFYISKHFTWLPDVVTEARLWQARCYNALDWLYESENTLHQVKDKNLTTKSLRNLYNLTRAGYLVRSGQMREAVVPLREAARSASGSQRNRLWFLLGQVYSSLGDNRQAYEAYKKAGSGASTAYRTKFNARIKRSEVFTGTDIKGEVGSLRSMTRYERNKDFLDQIYYAIGNLYMSRRDSAEALKNYRLAVEKSTRGGIDKALAQLALGGIYFARAEYVEAQPMYSEAVPQLPATYPGYKMLKRRSDVLDELATFAGNVHLQDSLLTLAALTPEQRQKACDKLAEEYRRKEKEAEEAAKREEFMAEQAASGNQLSTGATMPTLNTDKSWYFYNNTAKSAGKTEFQRRWGARKNEDDWRRRNKSTFSFDELSADDAPEEADSLGSGQLSAADAEKRGEAVKKENDPREAEYYLRQIPSTPEELQTCNDVIQEGLYNMGVILKDKLDDYPAARSEFDRLLTRYPDNIYRLDTYYNLYLMAVRDDNTARAEHWRRLIMDEFPESAYAKAMADPQYFANLRRMNAVQEEMYERAYSAYLSDRNEEVHTITEEMRSDYPLSKILPKFVFINALSYLTQGDTDKFKENLEELLKRWPETDMTPMAGAILKGLAQGRTPHSGETNARGMLWDTRLTASGDAAAAADGQPADFERDPEKPQYLVFAFPRDSVSANQVLYDVARFNFSSFVVKDFDLEPMSFGNVGLLIVKGFANLRELEHYRTVMARQGPPLPEAVRPIMISKANFELLLREGRSFEEYFRFRDSEPEPPLPPDDAAAAEADGGEGDDAGAVSEGGTESHAPEAPEEAAEEAPEEETPLPGGAPDEEP